jgi:pseudouridine synthase
LPQRVYPVGRLDYDASGLILLTNDGELMAALLRQWQNLPQTYHVKVKGRLTPEQLDQFGREAGARMRSVRQPDAARGHVANFWYEVSLKDSKRDELRRVLFAAQHPAEKLKRIAMGPLTLEGLPPGHYRALQDREVAQLRRALTAPARRNSKNSSPKSQRSGK